MFDIGVLVKAFGGLATAVGIVGILLLAMGGPLPPEQVMTVAITVMTVLLIIAGIDLVFREPTA